MEADACCSPVGRYILNVNAPISPSYDYMLRNYSIMLKVSKKYTLIFFFSMKTDAEKSGYLSLFILGIGVSG